MIAASVVHAALQVSRTRTIDELRHDLVGACASLGELAAEWTATGYVPRADIEAVDRTIDGVRRLLVQLRVQGGGDA